MSEDRPILIRRDCLSLVEDLVVASLLSQIVYWSLPGKNGNSKLTVKRYGVYWIAKTREEWMAETGLTLDQYRRAILVLKSKQLIEVRVMKFHYITMSHIRLRQSIAGVVIRPSEAEPTITKGGKPPLTAQAQSPQLNEGKSTAVIVHRLPTEITSSLTCAADRRAESEAEKTGKSLREGKIRKEVPRVSRRRAR